MLRAGVVAAAALALAACSAMGTTPSSPTGAMQQPALGAPVQQSEPNLPTDREDAGAPVSETAPVALAKSGSGGSQPNSLYTCAKSPPQYEWIFKGACQKITLKPTGAAINLPAYDDITIKGSIGKNNVKTTATVYLADATDTGGDIESYKGKAFDKYKAEGTTFVYAVAINQSNTAIKPIAEKNKPILQYIITDSKGLPGTECGAAVLTTGEKGSLQWATLPGGPFKAKGDTVTITQYSVPSGFELPPKTPLYFAVNCFK